MQRTTVIITHDVDVQYLNHLKPI